jgi:hypothetical protein
VFLTIYDVWRDEVDDFWCFLGLGNLVELHYLITSGDGIVFSSCRSLVSVVLHHVLIWQDSFRFRTNVVILVDLN